MSRTADTCILLGQNDSGDIGYTDADRTGYKVARKSTGGLVFSFSDGEFAWIRKMQTVAAHSSV